MTWSYSGDPSESKKDAVRFLIGDTDEDEPIVQDEEITWALSQWSDEYMAGAAVCESIAAAYASISSVSADGMSFSGGDVAQSFNFRAEALRKMSGLSRKHGAPYVGGMSWSERVKADKDSDKIPTAFRSHMHDHPDSGSRYSPGKQNPLLSDQQ